MIVITGTQRSGTSVTARLLSESGFDLQSNLWHEDIDGGYEHEVICGFYREYLGDPTFPFDNYPWPHATAEDFQSVDARVAKFSFLLMNPILVTIWRRFRGTSDRLLILKRPTADVVRSKERVKDRFSHDSILLAQDPTVLRAHFDKSLCLVEKLGFEYATLPFPEFLEDRATMNRALGRLDPTVQVDRRTWSDVVDPSKVHFR